MKKRLRKDKFIMKKGMINFGLLACLFLISNIIGCLNKNPNILYENNKTTPINLETYFTEINADDEDNSLVPVELIRVVDGDTLVVLLEESEIKVRLIGIDTPESVHVDKEKNNQWGEAASVHTKEIVESYSTLYLEFDVDKEDQYGRYLAYVWLNKDMQNTEQMLNARILKDGYARNKVYLPNKKYSEFFEQLCKEAKANNIGLWAEEGYRNLD